MRQLSIISAMILTMLAFGCDEKKSPPAGPTTAQTTPGEESIIHPATRPTTQALLNQSRRRLSLTPYAPLSVEVPESWVITSLADGRLVLLEGPTPTDSVRLSISARQVMTADEVALLEEGAKHENIAHPEKVPVVNFSKLGNAQLYERVEYLDRSPATSASALPPAPASVRWSFQVFIPIGDQFHAYELSFVGLPISQYEADKAFLKSIMDTLKLESDAIPKGQ